MDSLQLSQASTTSQKCSEPSQRQIIYYCQVVAIYIIVIVCIMNLSLGGDKDTVWVSMISASLGYLLPSHFYLTLPSNSSHQFYPNNTMTDFTTKLASTVELTNEWEIGRAHV